MSGRNNRIVRNRDRSSNFEWNENITKIVICIGISILVIVLLFFVGSKLKKSMAHKKLVETQKSSSYEYFILSNLDGAGVIDKKGNILIEPKYDNIVIPDPTMPIFVCQTEEKTVVLNEKSEEILTQYESVDIIKSTAEVQIQSVENSVLKYQKDGRYGMIDLQGNVIVEPIYEEIQSVDYRPGRILVKKGEKYGVIDSAGNIVIDTNYDQIASDNYWSEKDNYQNTGYIVGIKKEDGISYGYLNAEGKIVLDTKYESLERVLEQQDDNIYLIAMQKGKKGVFKNKKKLIDLKFQDVIYADLSNIFIVNKNGKYGFYKRDGRVILNPEYETYEIAGNYISVKSGEETKLFDVNGNPVGTNSYKKMIETQNPSYFIAEDGNGYYSIISKEVNIDQKFIQVEYAFDDYFIFTDESSKAGVINALTQEVVVAPQYDFIVRISDMNVLQAIDGMQNIIDIYDKDLKKVLSMEDGIVEMAGEKHFLAYSQKDMKYFDENGQSVTSQEVYPNQKMYATEEDGRWGYVNADQKKVVPCEYDIVTELNEYGFAGIKKEGKWGVIDEDGNVVVEPSYEIESYYFPQFIGKYRLVQEENVYCEEIENE